MPVLDLAGLKVAVTFEQLRELQLEQRSGQWATSLQADAERWEAEAREWRTRQAEARLRETGGCAD